MRLLRGLFDFYINSSIHVALAVYALVRVTQLQFGIPYDEAMLYFAFYATITGYNFVKYAGVAKFHHRRLTSSLKIIQVFSLISFLLLAYYTWYLEHKTLLVACAFGLITFFYAIPFLPKKLMPIDSDNNLRGISGVKIYVIALVWAGVTVILPVINAQMAIDTDVVIEAVQRFIFVLVLMVPFEIRDMAYDNLKLGTLPQRIGVKWTKGIAVLLLMPFFLLEFFKDEVQPSRPIVLAFLALLLVFFVLKSKKEQTKYYSSFWVEAIPIAWLVIAIWFER